MVRTALVALLVPVLILQGCVLEGVIGGQEERYAEHLITSQEVRFSAAEGATALPDAIQGQYTGTRKTITFTVPEDTTRLDVHFDVTFTSPGGSPPPAGPEGQATLTVVPAAGDQKSRTVENSAEETFDFRDPEPGQWDAVITFTGEGSVRMSANAQVLITE